jgi:hypothetical protein
MKPSSVKGHEENAAGAHLCVRPGTAQNLVWLEVVHKQDLIVEEARLERFGGRLAHLLAVGAQVRLDLRAALMNIYN